VLQEFLAGRAEGKPPAEQVEAWAREHGLPNPYDMGTRNWEQCLYDLGYVGGVDHGIEPHPPGDAGPGYRGRPRVLVTGTGKRDGLTDAELWASEAVGRAFARAGYGLIVGGWPGVDYVVAEEYEESLGAGATAAGEMLTQVIASGQTPDYPGGTIVHAESDSDSYDEAIRRADAVVLIGGLGGTRETFERARKSGVPIFPLAGTGGDAADAFERLRVDRRAHDLKGLERPIKSPRDADVLAETLIERLANAGRTRA
jgi:hypothetical protein